MFDHLRAHRRSLLDSASLIIAAVFFAVLFAGFPVAALDIERNATTARAEAHAQHAALLAGADAEDELAMLDRCRDLLGLDGKSDAQPVNCSRGQDDAHATR